MNPGIAESINLFNDRKFFEAHEALEAVWLRAQGDEKLFLHGLIQIAAAFHHHEHGNVLGFRSLLEKGLKKLDGFGDSKQGVKLGSLRQQVRLWLQFLDGDNRQRTHNDPPLPRIESL